MEKKPLWQRSLQEVFTQLDSGEQGLTDQEASKRLRLYGFNTFKAPSQGKGLILFLSQFNSPLIWLLCSAAVLSMFLGDISNPIIIMSIVLLSGLLGFFQERGAIML